LNNGFPVIITLVITVASCCILSLTHYNDFSKIDPLKTFTESKILTFEQLFLFRCLCLAVNLGVILFMIFDRSGIQVTAITEDMKAKQIQMFGLLRFSTFTVWSWCLQGIFFSCSIIMQILKSRGMEVSCLLGNTTYVLFEISFVMAILITVIVSFVLIPHGGKTNTSVLNFFTPSAVLMHNANILFMVLELIFNNCDHFHIDHLPFVYLYGLCYSVFSWFLAWFQGIYFYFFINQNFKYATVSQLAILVALAIFYGIGWAITTFMNPREHSWSPIVLVVSTWLIGRYKMNQKDRDIDAMIKSKKK